jgi:hypothetical protein
MGRAGAATVNGRAVDLPAGQGVTAVGRRHRRAVSGLPVCRARQTRARPPASRL